MSGAYEGRQIVGMDLHRRGRQQPCFQRQDILLEILVQDLRGEHLLTDLHRGLTHAPPKIWIIDR